MTNFRTLIVCATAIALTIGCKEHLPPTSSEPYNRLHGIQNDGKTVNSITLVNETTHNVVTLQFPPDIYVSVYTAGSHDPKPKTIEKGFANEVWVDLDFNKIIKERNPIRSDGEREVQFPVVQVQLSATALSRSNETSESYNSKSLAEVKEKSQPPVERQEWGLLEYRPLKNNPGPLINFLPMDDSYRTQNGARLFIACDRKGSTYMLAGTCFTTFTHPSGISGRYIWTTALLPYWNTVDHSVQELVDRITIKKTKG
jgi:hypothetical protein